MHDLKRNSAVLSYGQNCIVWIGAYTDTGYGHKHVTWPDGQKSTEKAHRLAHMAHRNILCDKIIVSVGFKATISAAFTADVCNNPRKKNMLNPKRPINPVNSIFKRFF